MKLEQTQSDINQYGEKYHFYYNEDSKTIICTTLYKCQMVRGIAKCDPSDEFNIDDGKKLAYLRCRYKFSHKKLKHSHKVCNELLRAFSAMQRKLIKAHEFVNDSEDQFEAAHKELASFELQLNK